MTDTTVETLFCYNHPDRETSLRCNNCNRPICASCAVLTPTGYRCKGCVKGQQQIFNTAEWYDYLIGFFLTAFLSGIAAFLVTLVGNIGYIGWILVIAGAPAAGTVIAEILRIALRKHRSRNLFITVAAGVVVGALPVLLFQIMTLNVYGIIFQVIYLALATPVVYTRLSGIRLSR
jgi:hypothetical protein